MPERAQACRGIVPGSGGVSAEPFAWFDPSSWSWKTSQGSLLEDSTSFSGPWPVSGVMRNGKLYARATSGRHSFARESSLWLTPNATPGATSNNGENAGRPATGKSLAKQADGRWPTPDASMATGGRITGPQMSDTGRMPDGSKRQVTLNTAAARSWPTPQTRDGDSSARTIPAAATARRRFDQGRRNLDDALAMTERATWPTPTSGDSKGAGSRNLEGSSAHAGVSLTDAVRFGNSTTPRQTKWPTPTVMDAADFMGKPDKGRTGPNSGHTLTGKAVRDTWMTPQSRDHKGISQKVAKGEFTGGLPDQLLGMQRGADGPPAPENPNTDGSRPASSPRLLGDVWPTPQAYQAPEGMGKPTSTPLDRAVTEPGPSRATKGGNLTPRPLVLNPRWVLTLMGFPATYLDGVAPPSKRSATRSSPRSAPSSPAVSVS